MLCFSFCNSFFQPFLLHGATANLQKVLFFRWFFNVFTFRHQRPHTNHPIQILLKINFILASEIEQNGNGSRSSNYHRLQHRNYTVLSSILGPILAPFWRLWRSKRSGRVKALDVWYSACLLFGSETSRRPYPEQFWHHFGCILEPLLGENWYGNSPIQTNNATTEQTNNTTTQQSNNPTIQSLIKTTRWLDAGWWGSAKRKQLIRF